MRQEIYILYLTCSTLEPNALQNEMCVRERDILLCVCVCEAHCQQSSVTQLLG